MRFNEPFAGHFPILPRTMKNLILLLVFGLAWSLHAQTQPTNAPRTYFQSYNLTADVPLLKGITVIGTINSQVTYPVEIRAERLINLQTSNTISAVSIHTHLNGQTSVDYIDYDELDGLIRAIQMIGQTDGSASGMDTYEAVFRTRCGMSIFKVSNNTTKLTIEMRSGDVPGVRNQMATFVLDDLGRYLTAAKAKLDSLASGGH
jgi:hypothetical protein